MKRWILLLAGPTCLAGCHYEVVDPAPAVAVTTAFYGALQASDSETALGFFSHDFNAQSQWSRLLKGLNERYGPVTSADLQGASLSGDGKSPCYLLTYVVKRNALAEDDLVLVCRDSDPSHWSIRGQKLTRRDTQQSIAGGILPTEIGVKIP